MPTPKIITRLQLTHAAYIEAVYTQQAQLTHNPHAIEIPIATRKINLPHPPRFYPIPSKT